MRINTRLKRFGILVVVFVTASLLFAASPQNIITNVRDHMIAIQPVRIEFQQQFNWKVTGKSETFEGEMVLAGPEKFRITTPDQTIVSNGSTMWTYSKLENQVIIDSVRRESRTLMPRDILFSFPEEYQAKIWKRDLTFSGQPTTALQLYPDKNDQYFQRLRVWVNTDSWEPLQVQFTDVNGNETTYQLLDIRQDTTLADTMFNYTPRKSAEVIDVR